MRFNTGIGFRHSDAASHLDVLKLTPLRLEDSCNSIKIDFFDYASLCAERYFIGALRHTLNYRPFGAVFGAKTGADLPFRTKKRMLTLGLCSKQVVYGKLYAVTALSRPRYIRYKLNLPAYKTNSQPFLTTSGALHFLLNLSARWIGAWRNNRYRAYRFRNPRLAIPCQKLWRRRANIVVSRVVTTFRDESIFKNRFLTWLNQNRSQFESEMDAVSR